MRATERTELAESPGSGMITPTHKKIAVACRGIAGLRSHVSEHFGESRTFTVVEMSGEVITLHQVVDNPHRQHKKPGVVPDFVAGLGVDVVLTGRIGRRAVTLLNHHGVEVCRDITGRVATALGHYMRGEYDVADPDSAGECHSRNDCRK